MYTLERINYFIIIIIIINAKDEGDFEPPFTP